MLDEDVGFAGVGSAEASLATVDEPDLVLRLALVAEVRAVEVTDDGEDAAADRDTGLAGVPGFCPGLAKPLDLLGLQLMERHAGVLTEKCRAHQVHSLLGCPLGGLAGAGAPPDPLAQTIRVGLDPK